MSDPLPVDLADPASPPKSDDAPPVEALPSEVPPSVKLPADPSEEYLRECYAVLQKLENTPMGSHETRLLKDVLLTLFAPAVSEALKHQHKG